MQCWAGGLSQQCPSSLPNRTGCRERACLQPAACQQSRRSQQALGRGLHKKRHRNKAQPEAVAGSLPADARTGLPDLPAPELPAAAQGKSLGSLALRVIFGTALGAVGLVVITGGGWIFTLAVCLIVYQATQEFYGFVTSVGISQGHSPPPRLASALTTASCIGLSIYTHVTRGKATASLAVASFAVLAVHISLTRKPRFSQLASAVFGLFYCGYLPSFWIKLRLLAAPAVNSQAVHSWPVMFGGLTHWTVGLLASLMSVACVIAADTGAYFMGKSFGRTQLTEISPKKTVEGAAGGLACSMVVALAFHRLLQWPADPFTATLLGLLVFFASLFGDLIESVMKRDAGLKDASNIIPGHGGLLDRFDSYLFTGPIVFFVLRFMLPNWGL